jgi:EAL domain-containing protein (putative c-di-GMP-specific phosphodiesterase class I)
MTDSLYHTKHQDKDKNNSIEVIMVTNVFTEKYNRFKQFFLPTAYLRLFPPHFLVRSPIISLVNRAYRQGYHVALIVFEAEAGFHVDNVKQVFKKAVCESIENDKIIFLQQFWGDDIALFIKVSSDIDTIAEIEYYIKQVRSIVVQSLQSVSDDSHSPFPTGYIIMEKGDMPILEEIESAYQQALTMAKKRVNNEYCRLVHEVGQVIRRKQITLLSQPIVDVSSREIKAWEILTRGPKETPLEHPLRLFTLARQVNMLYPLELMVVQKTFELIKKNRCGDLIFINITPISLAHHHFIVDLEEILSEFPLIPPKQIVFEVTERESIDRNPLILVSLQLLRKKGFLIAVDDTGAGYASLQSITQIMPDIIKIDRSVIEHIDQNTVKESILRGLILIAKEAGSIIVAEGIETVGEASVLMRNGVDLAQGYFYARPHPMPLIKPIS